MNARRINLILWTTSAALLAAALLAGLLAYLTPADVEAVSAANEGKPRIATSQTSGLEPLAAFEPVWKLDLRKPLSETSAAAAQQSPGSSTTMPSTISVTLVGTIGQSLAMVRLAGGPIEVRGVGEMIGNAKIVEIRTSQVDLEVAGQRTTLHRPKDER